jgi:uncharacterized protein YceK
MFDPGDEKRQRLYGGVRLDLENGTECVWAGIQGKSDGGFTPVHCLLWGAYVLAVDLPMSLVADTLLLPADLLFPAGPEPGLSEADLAREQPSSATREKRGEGLAD